jgi:MoxR-like ATPase
MDQPSSGYGQTSSQAQQMLSLTYNVTAGIGAHLRQAILGRDAVIELLLIALLADGHALLEDYPGSGKTTLAKALGRALDPGESQFPIFQRIQFTPDLLPTDITGVSVFQPQTGEFQFMPGPLFSHIILADEINRTPPKVQSAMLESMAEKQVTAEGRSYPLDDLFFVIATQNPLDVTGTYPLPTPQLDRFLFKIKMDYIDRASELEVLNLHLKKLNKRRPSLAPISRNDLLVCRQLISDHVQVSPLIQETLVDIGMAIRADERILQGLSTRALVSAIPALQARAAIHGRDFVSADDLRVLGPYLFCHRMQRAPGTGSAEKIYMEDSMQPMERLIQQSYQASQGY